MSISQLYRPGLHLTGSRGSWLRNARVLPIDTRLCYADDFQFVRRAAHHAAFSGVVLAAMTNIFPEERAREIRCCDGQDGLLLYIRVCCSQIDCRPL
jgi:hypothetical protein